MVVYTNFPPKNDYQIDLSFHYFLTMICELQINIEIFPICVLFSASDSKSKFGCRWRPVPGLLDWLCGLSI